MSVNKTGKLMQAAVLTGPRKLEVREVRQPSPSRGEVRVQLQGCGVCASNLAMWEGMPWSQYPTDPGALGHEGWGHVDAVGADVAGIREGDRVALLGSHSYAEYDLVPASSLVVLPSSLASLPFPGEAFACAMNIFERSQIQAGQTVAIVGIGFLGAILTSLASRAKAHVIAISRRHFALQLAQEMGAKELVVMDDHYKVIERVQQLTGGKMCERVIEATGKQWPLDLAAELTGTRARLIIAGYHQDGPRQVNMQLWNWRGLDVVNAHERDEKVYIQGMHQAVEAAEAGLFDPRTLCTHSFPLTALPDAFEATLSRPDGFLKATLTMGETLTTTTEHTSSRKKRMPRLGFLGVGWIGRNRLEVIAQSGLAEIAVICDTSPEILQQSLALAAAAQTVSSYDELLSADIDGVIIATPSAQHAEQSLRALERGLPVFCQKPLGRNANETRSVVEAARKADRLLGIDLAYRFTMALQAIHSVISSGEIGDIYAANLVFHNAYGPDKEWFYDRSRSGGGCVMDLGIHLIDAALWILGFPKVLNVNSRLYSQGRQLDRQSNAVEDYATAQIDTDSGVTLNMQCSWRLSVGQDCIISADFFGSRGGAAFHNVNGSFYDFVAERYEGTKRIPLVSPPDNWPGRAALEWVKHLQANERFDLRNDELVRVAEVLDSIYKPI